ncbi:hypothetical protein C0J52_01407 [Blattella germanica]|nr:hypothetical protein C0J52_01407 [Blattella germanica]
MFKSSMLITVCNPPKVFQENKEPLSYTREKMPYSYDTTISAAKEIGYSISIRKNMNRNLIIKYSSQSPELFSFYAYKL